MASNCQYPQKLNIAIGTFLVSVAVLTLIIVVGIQGNEGTNMEHIIDRYLVVTRNHTPPKLHPSNNSTTNKMNITATNTSSPSYTSSSSSPCVDEEGWETFDHPSNKFSNVTCEQISELPSVWCVFFAKYKLEGIGPYDACCACREGGGYDDDNTTIPHVSYPPSIAPSNTPSTVPSQEECIDDPSYLWDESIGLGCGHFSPSFCKLFSGVWYKGKNTYSACCACKEEEGGGHASSQWPTITPSSSHATKGVSIVGVGIEYSSCAILRNYESNESAGEDDDDDDNDYKKGGRNKLLCWGRNVYGQVGQNNSVLNYEYPIAVDLGERSIDHVSLGSSHTCAVTNDDVLLCWGSNNYGQLGNNETIHYSTHRPEIIDVDSNNGRVKKVALGWDHTCALTMDDILFCWGRNDAGQLGDGTTINRFLPVMINFVSGEYAVDIATGNTHSCVLTNLNNVLCWGENYYGQLGIGSNDSSLIPANVNLDLYLYSNTYPTKIATGNDHTCVITNFNELWCWGRGDYYQLGDGNPISRNTPKQIYVHSYVDDDDDDDEHVIDIGLGGRHSCAVTNKNNVFCWGSNSAGQVCDGTVTSKKFFPTKMMLNEVVSMKIDIAVGAWHTCVVVDERKMMCCGLNQYNQLGDGTTISKPYPVTILPNDDFVF